METKEAIKLLGMWKIQRFTKPTKKEIEGFIGCLEQGGAYKQMCDKLCNLIISKAMNDNADNDILELEQKRYELEQKYFPKEAKNGS